VKLKPAQSCKIAKRESPCTFLSNMDDLYGIFAADEVVITEP